VLEFTGERVVPGQVDSDLWNEHVARYEFAARLARGRRVIDLGCGTGYGSALLAQTASYTLGVDVSAEAIDFARQSYSQPNLQFKPFACDAVPPEAGRFDLAVSFEVIEHLQQPGALVESARALLSPGGQFIVSTPNAAYYAESRAAAGPNPYHTHEFTLNEFRELLAEHFEFVSLFAQNHVSAVSFHPFPVHTQPSPTLRVPSEPPCPEESHFFVAVCAFSPQVGAPHFIYVPSSGNVLLERETHIRRLEQELAQKQQWLDKSIADLAELAQRHEQVEIELRRANEWARSRDNEIAEKASHIDLLESRIRELQFERAEFQKLLDDAERQIAGLHEHLHHRDIEFDEKVEHVQILMREVETWRSESERMTREIASLRSELEQQRTELEAHGATLTQKIEAARESKWLRLGRILGFGPDLRA
jgi:SAM-dependent methyltransferase